MSSSAPPSKSHRRQTTSRSTTRRRRNALQAATQTAAAASTSCASVAAAHDRLRPPLAPAFFATNRSCRARGTVLRAVRYRGGKRACGKSQRDEIAAVLGTKEAKLGRQLLQRIICGNDENKSKQKERRCILATLSSRKHLCNSAKCAGSVCKLERHRTSSGFKKRESTRATPTCCSRAQAF